MLFQYIQLMAIERVGTQVIHAKYNFPETNSSHLKIGGWKTTFLLGRPVFRGYVSFTEGIFHLVK